MKKMLCLTLVSLLVVPLAARAQGTLKIGTVDMNRTFREYNKTKDAEAKINDAKNQAKKEFDERADTYKKSLDDVNNLNKQLESPALSADKKASLAKDRDDKISSIKTAITLLGTREIRNLALTVFASKLFEPTSSHGRYRREALWTHSVGVAVASRAISISSSTSRATVLTACRF